MNTLVFSRSKPTSLMRFLVVSIVVATVTLMLISGAYATSSSTAIQEGVKGGTKQMYELLTAIVIPVAVVCFAWNAFKALFGGERGMETAKKNIFTIVMVLALVFLAPIAIEQVASWFETSSSSSGVFS